MAREQCKTCNDKLPDLYLYTGFCMSCAKREYSSKKKILRNTIIIGATLSIIFFLIVYFMQLSSDGTFYGTELGFNIYKTIVTMELRTLLVTCTVLFFVPFGIGFDITYLPDINTGYYEGNFVVNISKWFLFTALAPFIMIYLIFHILKLKEYLSMNTQD